MGKKNDAKLLRKINPLTEWTMGYLLGKGSFGEVFVVTNASNETMAAKVCEISCDGDFMDTKLEVEILTSCNHANILKAMNSYYWEKKIWMILELCSGGALDDVTAKMEGLDEITTRAVIYQCMQGLAYLHSKAIIHRDIKAGNIMLTEQGICKIADFGVSAMMAKPDDYRNTFIGTPYWMAPEVILTESFPNQKYNSKADVYSLALTAIELVEVEPPNSNLAPGQVMVRRLHSESPSFCEPEKWSPEFINFVTAGLIKDPNKRPTASKCLEHPFLTGDNIECTDPLVELFKIVAAFSMGEDVEEEEMEEEDAVLDLDAEDSDNTASRQAVTDKGDPSTPKNEYRTIKKTIKYEVNGVTKHKTFVKIVDNENKNQKERDRSMRARISNQLKILKIEEQRELKKLETAQNVQLNEALSKQKAEHETMVDKYNAEGEALSKWMYKEVEKKKLACKNEMDKLLKKFKSSLEKERKTQAAALKSKNKSKYEACYYEQDYIPGRQENLCKSLVEFREIQNTDLVDQALNLVRQKNQQLEDLLKNIIVSRFNQLIELIQLKRTHICAKLELVLQQRLRYNQKELSLSTKYMAGKLEAVKQEHIRINREIPRQNRNRLKKETDVFKKGLRKTKVKNERELVQKKQNELLDAYEAEFNELKKKQSEEVKAMEDDNEDQINEIVEYQDEKNRATHRGYQELLYKQSQEDELLCKQEIYKMFMLKRTREQEFESELASASTFKVDAFNVITPDMF